MRVPTFIDKAPMDQPSMRLTPGENLKAPVSLVDQPAGVSE